MNVGPTHPTNPTSPHSAQLHILTHYRSQLEAIEADYAELLKERYLLTGLPPNSNIIDSIPLSLPPQQEQQVRARVSELKREAMGTPRTPHSGTQFLRPTRDHQGRPPDKGDLSQSAVSQESQISIKDDPPISQIQHESSTLNRVLSLRQQGVWEPSRLPKVLEPVRTKSHWDHLLEEMAWLATDFEYERKLRAASLRRLSRAVERHRHEKESAERMQSQQEQAAIRRRASATAKQVHNFWSQMVKIVEWKEQIIDEHVKRYNLHSHLSDLLSQTESYSHRIRMGTQAPASDLTNASSSNESDSERSGGEEDEVSALKKEADLSLDDLVDSLPPEYLKKLLHNNNHNSIPSDPPCLAPSLSRPSLKEAEQELGNRELSDVAEAAQNLQPSGNTLSTTKVSTPVPPLLKGGQLREYQHIGLDWLSMLHSQGLNGFLADEMGLGKTIQTIAFLAHLACQLGDWGPHLVIVPTSVILNWEYEFKKWCPAFKLLTYYGNARVRRNKRIGWTKPNAFHVCITSYQLAVADQVSLKGKIDWGYIVLDEAQNIKNYKSQRWQTLLTFRSRQRLLLSGTPLQNSIMELWALMHFLMPELFSSHSDFKEWFSKPLMEIVEGNQTQREKVVERLHRILRPFLLRRLKCEVELQMPKKIEHVVSCHMSKRQKFLYEDYMSLSETRNKIRSGGALNLLNILMQLRKVCNHPDLFEPRPVSSPLTTDPLTLLLPSLVFLHALSRGFVSGVTPDKFFTFSRMGLDLISEVSYNLTAFGSYRALTLSVSREGFTPPNFPCKHSPAHIYPLTSSNSLPVGERLTRLLTSYNVERELECREYPIRLSRMYGVSSSRISRPLFYGADLIHSLTTSHATPLSPLSQIVDPLSEENYYTLATFSIYLPPIVTQHTRLVTSSPSDAPWCYQVTSEQSLIRASLAATRDVRLDRFTSLSRLEFPETRLIQYDCGKLQILDTLLYQLKCEQHRVLIFTQMSRMLNILETFLNYHGYKYLRLDGSTPPEERFYLVERFNNDNNLFVFILSTRSGGVGMNLTGADTVIFYDIDWNPTMDAQAQDRCHRIGQTKDVHIYRLICEGTIEMNILKKSQQKKLLGELAIEEGHFTADFFTSPELEKGLSEIAGRIGEDGNNLSSLLFEVEEDSDAKFAKHATNEAKISEESDLLEQTDRENPDSSILPLTLRSEIESEFLSLQEELNPIENYALFYLEKNLAHLPFKYTPSNLFSLLARDTEQSQNHFLGYSPAGYYFDSPSFSPLNTPPPSRAATPPPSDTDSLLTASFETMDWDALPPLLDADPNLYVDPFISSLYSLDRDLLENNREPVLFLTDDQLSAYKIKPHKHNTLPTSDAEFISSSNITRKSLIRKFKELPQMTSNIFLSIHSEEDKQRIKKRLKSKLINEPLKKSPTLTPEHFGRPQWLLPSEWRLCHCVLNHLEAPLGLISLAPSQELNWLFVSEYLTSIHAEIRMPSECHEHYLHALFRDKGIESDLQIQARHKEKIKRVRARVEQMTDFLVKDNNSIVTKNHSTKFQAILDIVKRRKPPQTHEPTSPLPYQSHATLLQNLNISPSSSHSAPLLFAQNKLNADKSSTEIPPNTPTPVIDGSTPRLSLAAKFTFQPSYPPSPTPPYPYNHNTPLGTPYPNTAPYSIQWDSRQTPLTPGPYSSLPSYSASRALRQTPYAGSPLTPQPEDAMDTSHIQLSHKFMPNYIYPKRYTKPDAYPPLSEALTPLQHQMTTHFFPKIPLPMPQTPGYSPLRTPTLPPQPSCSHLYQGSNSAGPYSPHYNSNSAYCSHSALNSYSPTPHTPLNSFPHHASSNAFNMNSNSNVYHHNSTSSLPSTPLANDLVQNDLGLNLPFFPSQSAINNTQSSNTL